MQQLSQEQVKDLLRNKPAGLSDRQVVESLVNRGYQLDGLASSQPKQSNPLQTAGNVLGSVFGGQKIGEAIGTQIAKRSEAGQALAEQERTGIAPTGSVAETFAGPTKTQIAGDVARVGLNFAPLGKLSALASKGAAAIGLGSKAAPIVGNVLAGGATGAAFDVADDVAEGRKVGLGAGTLIGAGIPAATPVASAISKAAGKLAGIGATEITGKLTGTSQETVKQAFDSAFKGGKDLDNFTSALRGKTTPEQIVNNMRESVSLVSQNNSALFRESLNELADNVVSTKPAKDNFLKTLQSVGIAVNDNGTLNFANNKLRNVTDAQNKIVQAWQEIQKMPDQLSIRDLDTTRQAVKAIKSIAGDQPSANLGNMLIEDATRSVRQAGEQVEGYGKMLDNFGETSEFLGELERGLATGDKKSVDEAYRRIATTLKTNNEQRMALVKELDEATGGSLLSDVAGQQLSEALPRGLVGTYMAPVIAGGAVAGGISPALLPGLLLASPRAVGEVARALGLGAAKTSALIDAIADARTLLLKAGILTAQSVEDGFENGEQNGSDAPVDKDSN